MALLNISMESCRKEKKKKLLKKTTKFCCCSRTIKIFKMIKSLFFLKKKLLEKLINFRFSIKILTREREWF